MDTRRRSQDNRRRASNRQVNEHRFLRTLITLCLLAGMCLGVTLVGWGVVSLPGWAESRFGPPAATLDPVQKILLSVRLLQQANDLQQPVDPLGLDRSFSIALGEPIQSITSRLEGERFISSAAAFQDYLVYAGLDTTLQAGNYELSPRLSAIEIAHNLQDATPNEVTFTVLPGWRMEEIAAALPTSGLEISPEEFLATAANPSPLSPVYAELTEGASLEGFLFPGSYTFERQTSPQAFVNTLVDSFQTGIGADLREAYARQGISLYQAVSLASIIQREAIVEDEMPIIASVFLNRLRQGMKLEADSTTQYALGYNPSQASWWTNPLSALDLQINSPYNTYIYAGLPPGPIANPGLQALQSVAYPAQTPYFFFRATCDGSGRHNFAENFDQHVQNACP